MPSGLEKIVIGGLLAVLAAIPWSFRDRISQQFASSYVATIDVRTTTERNDKRVTRAFATATGKLPSVDATIEYGPTDQKIIRKSHVHVTGASRDAAIGAARSMSTALESAFNAEGPDRLDTYIPAYVQPIAGETSTTVYWSISLGAGVVGLVALGLLVMGWKQNRAQQPDAGILQLPATLALIVLTISITPLVMTRWIFMALFAMAIPCAIAARIVGLAKLSKRAAQWPSTEGRIVASKPLVEYTYTVGGVEYRGSRVGIGDLSAGTARAENARKRYAVGHLRPVYYDPANPADSMLDREPPARVGVMYAGAALTILIGLIVVIAFSQISAIIRWFS